VVMYPSVSVSKPEILSVWNRSTAGHWYQGEIQRSGQKLSQKARLSVENGDL
jgi:hypothetical protein